MKTLHCLSLLSVSVLSLLRRSHSRDERGDVPGWVLVTVMTAGLVGALYALAKPQLVALLRAALNGVS